jgi:uncharacterized membrane protein YeaQ/YmgE (transglycosylase-associated protein family)
VSRTWAIAVSVVLGATAGWAAYFAWGYRHLIGGQELLWGAVGAVVGIFVYQVTTKKR